MYRICDVVGCARRCLHTVRVQGIGNVRLFCTSCLLIWYAGIPEHARFRTTVTLFSGALVPVDSEDWRTSVRTTLMKCSGYDKE